MTTTTLTTPMDLAALGALRARYPMEWWVAGMVASALVGALALVGLRTAQHHSPPLRRFLPAQAYGVELAESWSGGGRWGTLDDAIAQGLRTHADTAVLQWFAVLTHLGDSWVLTGCTVVVAALLWACQQRLLATGWLVALAGNGALTKILKKLFERVRPEYEHGIAQAHGFSFPSGHSSASMAAFAMLAYLATRLL